MHERQNRQVGIDFAQLGLGGDGLHQTAKFVLFQALSLVPGTTIPDECFLRHLKEGITQWIAFF